MKNRWANRAALIVYLLLLACAAGWPIFFLKHP